MFFCFTSDDILAVAAVVAQAAYVLTVDTAISHLAAAFNKPMTVLFTDQPKAGLPRAKRLEHLISFAPKTANTQILWAEKTVNLISLKNIFSSVKMGFERAQKK